MDKNLFKTMEEINNSKKTDFTKDIVFIGTLTSDEVTNTGSVKVTKDIFMVIDKMPDGSIVQKFYDNDKNYIAGRDKDGKLYPSSEFAGEDLSFLNEINNLSMENGISFNEIDNKLEEFSKSLGISKEKILSISTTDLEQVVSKEDKGEDKLILDDSIDNDENTKDFNKNALENISSKQEIDLNKKIDDKYTLADILGVPAGSTLHTVYSDSIQDHTNTTKFSFVIEYPNGNIEPADMLTQVGGTSSDKNIYNTNRDGSKVEKENVQSSYAINSPLVKNAILTAKIGSMGYIELGYGQIDKTSNKDAFTHELETNQTYPISREVRDEFSTNKGSNNISENMDEIRMHEKSGCTDLSLKEADGDLSTGHNHDIILEVIKAYDTAISDVFSNKEILERFAKTREKYPDADLDELIERTQKDLSEDATHMRMR